MTVASLPFPYPVSTEDIQKKRASILYKLLAYDAGFCSIPVISIRKETLQLLLSQYDELFLQGYLGRKLSNLQVTISMRLTSSAGKFICIRGAFGRIKQAEIRMSGDFLLRLNQGPFQLNGLLAATPQEAFLMVFEHELCHALETLLYGKTGHSIRFLALAGGLFGHTATRHSLPTRRHEAAADGLHVGSRVRFSCQGNLLCGVVTYIGKQATVIVPSVTGEYRDRSGTRYAKYRAPLSSLTSIDTKTP